MRAFSLGRPALTILCGTLAVCTIMCWAVFLSHDRVKSNGIVFIRIVLGERHLTTGFADTHVFAKDVSVDSFCIQLGKIAITPFPLAFVVWIKSNLELYINARWLWMLTDICRLIVSSVFSNVIHWRVPTPTKQNVNTAREKLIHIVGLCHHLACFCLLWPWFWAALFV